MSVKFAKITPNVSAFVTDVLKAFESGYNNLPINVNDNSDSITVIDINSDHPVNLQPTILAEMRRVIDAEKELVRSRKPASDISKITSLYVVRGNIESTESILRFYVK